MVAAGLIFLTVDAVQRRLKEGYGADYAVVAVTSEKGLIIYDDPKPWNHPTGQDLLEKNLIGARVMHGPERTLLVHSGF